MAPKKQLPKPPAIVKGRLVGQPLLYAVSCFASLGVFLFGYECVQSQISPGAYMPCQMNEGPTRLMLILMVSRRSCPSTAKVS